MYTEKIFEQKIESNERLLEKKGQVVNEFVKKAIFDTEAEISPAEQREIYLRQWDHFVKKGLIEGGRA